MLRVADIFSTHHEMVVLRNIIGQGAQFGLVTFLVVYPFKASLSGRVKQRLWTDCLILAILSIVLSSLMELRYYPPTNNPINYGAIIASVGFRFLIVVLMIIYYLRVPFRRLSKISVIITVVNYRLALTLLLNTLYYILPYDKVRPYPLPFEYDIYVCVSCCY